MGSLDFGPKPPSRPGEDYFSLLDARVVLLLYERRSLTAIVYDNLIGKSFSRLWKQLAATRAHERAMWHVYHQLQHAGRTAVQIGEKLPVYWSTTISLFFWTPARFGRFERGQLPPH